MQLIGNKNLLKLKSDRVIKKFNKEKIVIARLTKKIQATFDNQSYYLGKYYLMADFKLNPFFFLAILNSNVSNFYFSSKFDNVHLSQG